MKKKRIVKLAHAFLPSRTSLLAPKSQTRAQNATWHRQQRRTMSGNGRLTQQQSTSAPTVEGRTVWVPSTLFRRQLVNLFSHNVSGGGNLAWGRGNEEKQPPSERWENTQRPRFISAALRFQVGGVRMFLRLIVRDLFGEPYCAFSKALPQGFSVCWCYKSRFTDPHWVGTQKNLLVFVLTCACQHTQDCRSKHVWHTRAAWLSTALRGSSFVWSLAVWLFFSHCRHSDSCV